MFAKRFLPLISVAVCAALFSTSTRAQDVAEAARKAKAKKQQEQGDANSTSTATKPKTYTSDDFARADEGKGAAGQDIMGTTEKPAPGKDTAIVILNVPTDTIKRPGGTQAFWSVKNTSDHWLDLTITLIVTGPCGYRQVHPVRFRLNNGGGFGDKKAMGTMIYQDNCPGEYAIELRAESFHNLLSTASTTVKVL